MKLSDRNYSQNSANFYIAAAFLILTGLYLLTENSITDHKIGLPLDDGWIHLRFSENFAAGHFFEYNIGEPIPGTTSPFWVIISSIGFILKADPVIFILFLSSLFFLFLLFGIYKLCLKLKFDDKTALVITLLVCFSGRLLWSSLSGMEVTLFTFLSVLIALKYLKEIESQKIYIATGLLLGISVNVRPECFLLALVYFVIQFKFLKITLNRKSYILSLLIFIVLSVPYPIFSYIHSGHFLPNTFKAQQGELLYMPNFTFIIETSKLFFKDNCIILLLWIISTFYFIYELLKKKADIHFLLINLWIFLLPVVSAFLVPNYRHHGRYLIPLIPFIIIITVYRFNNDLNKYLSSKLRKAALILIFILTIGSAALYGYSLGWNVDNINDQQVNIAYWVKNNLPDEKVIALNDIGAITFITKKRIVDTEGLVNSEVLEFRLLNIRDQAERMMKMLKREGANYLIIYPHWYPEIMGKYGNAFTQVYSAKLEKNTICGGVEMFVFKINWDKIKLNS